MMKTSAVLAMCLALVGGVLISDLSAATAAVTPAKATPKRVSCEGLGEDSHEQNSVQAWLAMVDGGDYKQTWFASSEVVRCHHTECSWFQYLCTKRKPWGKVISRELIDKEFCCNPKHFPEGQYYWFQYNTCFECGGACETVAIRCESDCACGCRWRVVHYSLN